MKTTSWIMNDEEEKRMNKLKKALNAKSYSHVFRVATSELEAKIFAQNNTHRHNKSKTLHCSSAAISAN